MRDELWIQCLWIVIVFFMWVSGYSTGKKKYYQACRNAVKQREQNSEIARELLNDDQLPINMKINILRRLFDKDKMEISRVKNAES